MLYSFLGFNQEKIAQTVLDITDVVLLQYIIRANGNPTMNHITVDGISYVWLSHKKIHEDLPILRLAESTLRNKLSALKQDGWIISHTHRGSSGSKTYYSVSIKTMELTHTEEPCTAESTSPCTAESTSDNKLIDNKLIDISTKVEMSQAKPGHRHLITVDTPDTVKTSSPKKKSLYAQCMDRIESFTEDDKTKQLLTTYLRVRLDMKEYPLYPNQWKGYMDALKDLVDNGQDVYEVIQQSINRGYKGFFEVKKYNRQTRGQDKSVFSEYGVVKSAPTNEEAMNVQF